MRRRRRKRRKGEGSPNDERQTSFRFLPPLLVKRPILSVGWNLSDFSPCYSPSGACRMSLSSSLPFVSGFLLRCSGCVGVGVVGVVTLGGELRLEVKAGISPGCEGQSQKKVALSSLIQSRVMNGPCHPSTAPTRSSSHRSPALQ